MVYTLLVIEDDVSLSGTFKVVLTQKGFQVELAHTAKSGLNKAYALNPDLIILDVILPDMDGWQTCTRLREMSDVPIIMLTSLGSSADVAKGLELGADDYIVKPVTAEQLTARIRALLRRIDRSKAGYAASQQLFQYDYLTVDLLKYIVTVDGKPVKLSPTEFRLLAILIKHHGRLLSHTFLLSQVWGPEYTGEVDYLRLYISYLRRKLERKWSKPCLIHSEWGVGYRLG